jgi:glycosyltransferase involved in cell wall biosynthesis
MPAQLKVLALTQHGRLSPSSRMRILQFIPILEQKGICVSVAPLLADTQLGAHLAGRRYDPRSLVLAYLRRTISVLQSRRYDVLWIGKEMFPWLPGVVESMPRLLHVPYVVDYDDATFHQYDQHSNRLARLLLGAKVASLMRHAAVVLAGNPYLAAYARVAGARNIFELPTVVDMLRYPLASPRAPSGCLRIGWIGTPSTAKYLEIIRDPLRELARRRKIKLVVVGAQPPSVPGVPVESRRWDEATEASDIRSFDIGIMPLLGDPWALGKCGYKLIQYMASGIPVVASPVGVNREIVEPGRTGFLASSPEEWVTAWETLGNDAGLREAFGRSARIKVNREYSLASAAPVLTRALREAASSTANSRTLGSGRR